MDCFRIFATTRRCGQLGEGGGGGEKRRQNILKTNIYLIISGKSCHNRSLWQPSEHERGVHCHKLEPPEPKVHTPNDALHLTFIIHPLTASALADNDLYFRIVFSMPEEERSSKSLGSEHFLCSGSSKHSGIGSATQKQPAGI